MFTYVCTVFSCLPMFATVYQCLYNYVDPFLPMVTLVYLSLPLFTCLPMFTCVNLYLPPLTHACLPMVTKVHHVYQCLHFFFTYANPFTGVYLCLLVFTYVYHCFLALNYVDSCLPILTTIYKCLPMFTTVYSFLTL